MVDKPRIGVLVFILFFFYFNHSGGIKLPSLSVLKRNRTSSKATEVKKEAATASTAASDQNSGKVELNKRELDRYLNRVERKKMDAYRLLIVTNSFKIVFRILRRAIYIFFALVWLVYCFFFIILKGT